jgi:hypothetical protein
MQQSTQRRPNKNAKIIEELNIFNSYNKIIKIQITLEISCSTYGRHTNSEESLNIQAKKKKTTQHRAPTYYERTEEAKHGLI